MDEQEETALLAWARDADGDFQLFTGEDIYDRAGRWGMDRLRRDIPVIATYYAKAPVGAGGGISRGPWPWCQSGRCPSACA